VLSSVFVLGTTPARAESASAIAERPEIRDTAYAIPPAAYFVSLAGNDNNNGALDKPFRTLTRAVEAAPAGATIIMRNGTYREGVAYVSKRLTIQPYPHERVWLKGSLVSIWRKDNWAYKFDQDSYEAGAIDQQHRYAGHPDMVYVDGQPLIQVGTLADVGSEKFFVDYVSNKLYIGADPSGKSVEVAAFSQAMRVGADGTIIRGLGFMHYAGGRFEGALQFDSSNDVTVENNTFAWSASRGLAMYQGNGAIVTGNTFLNNGLMGYGSWRYDNVHIEGNRFAGNNQENFVLHGPVAEPAGAKLTVGRNWIIRDNVFENNLATGLWLDISNYNTTIVSNRVVSNLSYGIYYEISGKAIIGSNLIVENTSGIRVSNASEVKIYNNTLVGNQENISIQDDSRQNTDAEELSLGITYVSANIELKNNIFSNGDLSQNPFLWVRDYNSVPLKAANQMVSVSDRNAYYRTNSGAPSKLVSWWSNDREAVFNNLNAFQMATGQESEGIFIDDAAENPFFAEAIRGDYRLKSGSVAVGAGVALPSDVADAIGVAAGVPVDLGVLVLDWPAPAPLPPTILQVADNVADE